MITTLRIESQMNCEYICKRVHEAIIKYQKDNPDPTDSIVVIDIRKPSDNTDLIPKLEYKDIQEPKV
jgi:hypothetical protein